MSLCTTFCIETGIDALDYWTNVSLEAHWRELVRESQQASKTGYTIEDTQDTWDTQDIGDTGPSITETN